MNYNLIKMNAYHLIFSSALVILFSFDKIKSVNKSTYKAENKNDTIIASKKLNNELSGGNYRVGGTIYFPVINGDTIEFNCYLSESKNGKLTLDYRKDKYLCSHRDNLRFLELMLVEISKKYKLDSLKSIYLGRLITHGDLAIKVTKQYQSLFGNNYNIGKYQPIFNFFMNSEIANNFNQLLKPYYLKVDKISAEKIFFAYKSECLRYSKIEIDSSIIPDRILDGMTYITIKSINI
jgi:hypothetical protein